VDGQQPGEARRVPDVDLVEVVAGGARELFRIAMVSR